MSEENKASQPLAAGSTAPDFSLQARSGKTVSLRDFAGQKDVLVYFYPKDDTPGCTREACSLRDAWAELGKAGIEVLGISRDDAASHNAFAAKYNLPFELLTDADHSVHEAYGAWGQNPNPAWGVGPLRKSFLVGKDGRVKHVFDKVDTEHHAEQVLRAAGVAAPAPKPAPAAKPAAPAPPAPPAPKPAAPAAAAPVAAAPAARPPAPAAPKPPAPKPEPPKAAAPAKKAGPSKKAASKKKAAPKRKAAKKAKAAPKKKAARKVAKRKPAPKKKKAAKKAARKPARKAAKKTKKMKKTAPKRGAKKAAKRKKR